MCPGPTHTAIRSGAIPLSVSTSESRFPVSTSIPFMQSTNVLSETGYAVIRFMNPRKPCELIEITMISARETASSRLHVKTIFSSSATYSLRPVFFRTS